ncbi:PEP-CTERM sorting domain-containing protein [Aquabacterium soli]|uniref:PEP-CTERM sorting domain-containing protein n=1 Tax=Aquabacterium soli TaxID=2493092 RepID=A0A3R8S439_9BURK|nr:cohesin domain-containing protein [Aquabacterium soli]RRS05007.1 PEP-CTERM sorting domain-containing protein [Aquabacterium soli]
MTLQQHLIAAVLATTALWTQAQTIEVKSPVAPVDIGATFTIDIVGSGFPNIIYGGGYDVGFDASILRLDNVKVPAFWELGSVPGPIDNVAGLAQGVNFNTLAGKQGDFVTATLTFTALAGGTSAITLSASPLWPFADDNGEVAVAFKNGTVAAVPEPTSVAMVLAGLGLVAMRLRRARG